ncbi:MAG: orotidine-5'-phosphate decarboxylase [Anaerolineae bacterium]|nr:orotidine-5'-phosphate decarboxylase [Anaerolineae bacterium]
MSKSFQEKLTQSVQANNSLLCVGLDPDPARMPDGFMPEATEADRIRAFCLDIIDRTSDLVCAYKPNAAFFEQAGPEGMAALRDVIAAVPDGIPVLLDAKRGDIGNTAKAYARAAFEVWGADAVTVNPYLGRDSVTPFLEHAGKAVFLLCHTSNPSAAEVQHHGTPQLYQHVVRQARAWGDTAQIGFVVGATQPQALKAVRRLVPEHWILAPGVGAQGGDLAEALSSGMSAEGSGVIVPVARSVLYASDPRVAAMEIRRHINAYRSGGKAHRELILALFSADCVQFGDFTLASGQHSPVYIDLRRVISYPELFQQVVAAYADLIERLTYDHIAAVPYAALPAAAAIAMRMRRPLIYPRKEAKDHGTGRDVEGAFEPGQVAVAIEDVVTSGGSVVRAIEAMEAAGLEVDDVVVLVDREQGGREQLQAHGVRLHAVLTLREILTVLRDVGAIDAETVRRVQAYLAAA